MKVGKKKTVRSEKVTKLMESLNKQYGEGTVCFASEAVSLNLGFISTGNYRLDFGLGGGIPVGRMMEMFGREQSGKTSTLLSTIREFQRKFPDGIAVFIDFENTFDPKYAEAIGVDLERLIIISPDHGEQGIDLLNKVMQLGMDLFIGVDSIAAIVSTSTVEVDAEKAQVGVQARMVNRMVAVANTRMKRNLVDPSAPTTTVVFLNQEREKVGVMFGDPTTTPGGKGKNFFTSVRVRLFVADGKANRVYVDHERNGIKRKKLVGKLFSFSVVKNKVGGDPFADGECIYYVRPYKGHPQFSYDNAEALIEHGKFYDLIQVVNVKKSAKLQWGNLVCSEEEMRMHFIENEEDAFTLHEDIVAALREDSSEGAEVIE